mmetsp:Transcript_46797/g.77960  ORF Transcript_46797/g.77960 Transcript_46797/m.77960 type:complete len:176 (-) Transcript_46797:1559-2086(-)
MRAVRNKQSKRGSKNGWIEKKRVRKTKIEIEIETVDVNMEGSHCLDTKNSNQSFAPTHFYMVVYWLSSTPAIVPLSNTPTCVSGISHTAAIVVIIIPATDPAYVNAARSTFAGSMIPEATRSSTHSFSALYPNLKSATAKTSLTVVLPSTPAFSAICFAGPTIAFATIVAPDRSS